MSSRRRPAPIASYGALPTQPAVSSPTSTLDILDARGRQGSSRASGQARRRSPQRNDASPSPPARPRSIRWRSLRRARSLHRRSRQARRPGQYTRRQKPAPATPGGVSGTASSDAGECRHRRRYEVLARELAHGAQDAAGPSCRLSGPGDLDHVHALRGGATIVPLSKSSLCVLAASLAEYAANRDGRTV